MGSVNYHASEYTSSGKVSASREIRKEVRGLLRDQAVLADAFVNNVYYAAIRDNKTSTVFAIVCKTWTSTADYYNFGYKLMEEFMGPNCFDCPDRILDLLTETDSDWANKWRERCRENNRMKKAPTAFGNLPEGARAEWIAPKWLSGFEEGAVLTLRKGRQNGWKKRSPWVWHIEGTRWCVKPSMVGNDYKVIG